MAFPTVEATAETSVNTAGTSHAITLPASIAASDLVLITMDIGSTSATLNSLAGWTELLDENLGNGLKIIYYTGAGVPSNPTFTSSSSTRSATISWRISGVNKSIAPEIGSTSTGTSATPDPPASASPGSTKDYLFIAFAGMAGEEADDDTWGNTPPANYTPSPPLQKSCGTAGTNLGGLILAASRQLNTGSAQDPGTFDVDSSAAWRAQTIMVHPIVNTLATPGVLALAISTFAPTVTKTDNVRVVPAALSQTIAAFAPTVLTPRLVTPTTTGLVISAFAPTVQLPKLCTPTTASLAITSYAPSALAPRLCTPATLATALTAYAPTVQLPQRCTPSTNALTLSLYAPTVVAPQLCTPATYALTLTPHAPIATASSSPPPPPASPYAHVQNIITRL